MNFGLCGFGLVWCFERGFDWFCRFVVGCFVLLFIWVGLVVLGLNWLVVLVLCGLVGVDLFYLG